MAEGITVDEALEEADDATRYGDSLGPTFVAVLAAEVRRLRKGVAEMSEDLNEVMARGDL